MADWAERYVSSVPAGPKKMLALAQADGLSGLDWKSHEEVLVFPPKSIDEILAFLKSGNGKALNILDWVALFDLKGQWDEGRDNEEIAKTSANIFDAILVDPRVLHMALFRIAITLDGGINRFPPVLMDHLGLLGGRVEGVEKQVLELVLAAREDDFNQIAEMAFRHGESLTSLFARLNLPRCTTLLHKSWAAVPSLISSLNVNALKLLVPWLDAIWREDPRVSRSAVASAVILREDYTSWPEEIFEWLERACKPRAQDSIWPELEDNVRSALGEIISLSEYETVNRFARMILRSKVREMLGFEDYEVRHLGGRAVFWQHYAGRMLSVRLLLSPTTANYLNKHEPTFKNYEILRQGDNQKDGLVSDLIVLEFESYILVEPLRSPYSEVRAFAKSFNSKNLLLSEEPPELNQILSSHQDSVHDHISCWQWSCERWLRTELGIEPDENVTTFRIGGKKGVRYSVSDGLEPPPYEWLKERDQKLPDWRLGFISRERALGKYGEGNQTGFLEHRLMEAREHAFQGDFDAMIHELQQAVERDSVAAMKLLSTHYLTHVNTTYNERNLAKSYLRRAIELGDTGAEVLYAKYFRRPAGGKARYSVKDGRLANYTS